MNLTDEDKFVVLLSVSELGGAATKADTLNHIELKGYYKLNASELAWKDNRNEQVWRNRLAFARKRLEREGHIDGSLHDNWALTEQGRNYLSRLAQAVSIDRFLQRITPAAQIVAQALPKTKASPEENRMPYDE